jgi:hypothetical protein
VKILAKYLFRNIADFKLTIMANKVIAHATVRLPDSEKILLFELTANDSETAREQRAAILLQFHYLYFEQENKETALQLATAIVDQ